MLSRILDHQTLYSSMKEKTLTALDLNEREGLVQHVFFFFGSQCFFGSALASNLYFKRNLPRFCFCPKLYLSFRFDENGSAITTSPSLT